MSRFSDICGYDKIKDHLQGAIALDKVSHAYIINGGFGAGKKLIAKTFAKALQCEDMEASFDKEKASNMDFSKIEPCGKCHSCIQVESNNQPDIIWVKHEKPASIGVEDIREQLINDVQIKPYSSKYKVYIIDEAEKLTPQAQNALLKTIEEPPAYCVVLLLTTNADIFLQTILSRCVMLDLKPLSDDLVYKYLRENCDADNAKCTFAASFAQGRIGRAISIAESEDFEFLKDQVLHVVKNAKEMTTSDIMTSIKSLSDKNFPIDDFLDMLAMWFRDVLMFKSTNDTNGLYFKDYMSIIRAQAEKMSYEGIEDVLNSTDKVKLRLKANVNFELCIELLLMAIREDL